MARHNSANIRKSRYYGYILRLVFTGILFFNITACDRSGVQEFTGIEGAAAHWVSPGQLIWDAGTEAENVEIRYSHTAEIRVTVHGISGGSILAVKPATNTGRESTPKYRHLTGRPVFQVAADSTTIRDALRGQIIAIAYDGEGNPIRATRVQHTGVIDALYTYPGTLGPQYTGDEIILNVWAPTAQELSLKIYDDEKNPVRIIQAESPNPADGVWRFRCDLSCDRAFYRLDITVYHHENNRVNTYEVTDPYSVSLSTDSRFSQFADLAGDGSLKPQGWDRIRKSQPRPVDITLYEAHMRDFSISDQSVPEEHRGTFLAMTYNGRNGRALSDGMAHLNRLAEAGLTHLHLLPVNDIATVNESPENRVDLDDPYARICDLFDHDALREECEMYGITPIREVFKRLSEDDPATDQIQKPYYEPGISNGMAAYDGFNWGYDPYHFNAPEGSYSTDPDGVTRIIELREMVKALDEAGLKVVVDVVYNHTFDSGLSSFSVLDKVVPGYYHRYDPDSGALETSTCCDNTAAENAMMEKLIIDSVILWAKHYKIDSFRFDLMGHHPRYVMENLLDALAELTLEEDGVDGRNIYIYGEGWNFGEVADNRIFEQATQFNMGGTGIGNFNDRLRDGVRGGNFTDRGRFQGFANGQYLFPNEAAFPYEPSGPKEAAYPNVPAGGDAGQNLAHLLEQADRIRVGMAGNLSTYIYINRFGDIVDGGNEMIGYTLLPQESVNYIDKHDNETLWDNTQTKLPLDMDMDARTRVHMLSNAFVNYGQGVPFYQMGSDILRSKSLDRNSYNSGDWFNAVDFTLETHNWGIGLPPGWDNRDRWDAIGGFLTNPEISVNRQHMEHAHRLFLEQLQIRYSSPLFRLETAEEIHKRVTFHNTGPDQVPGLIVMSISDGACAGEPLDGALDGIVVIFNASDEPQRFVTGNTRNSDNAGNTEYTSNTGNTVNTGYTGLAGITGLRLHPIQEAGADPAIRTATWDNGVFTVPALSAAVFVKPTGGSQGDFPCNPHQ
ncbi:MAG: pullulanase-type alpha-1,6-glucosidase [Cyclonatronaceae bacterium]